MEHAIACARVHLFRTYGVSMWLYTHLTYAERTVKLPHGLAE